MKTLAVALATMLATGAISSAAEASAGRVQFVYGDVRIANAGGAERRARRGDIVEEGDTITSNARSSAQLRMVDGAALAVRPSSEVRIDNYSYEKDEDNDRSFISLLRGTMRAITGLIGRSNRSSVRVSTATATIGIRGSDADIGFDPGTGLAAVRTNVGGHSMTSTSTGGTLQTNPGQIAIALPGQFPTFAPTFPFATPTPPAGAPGARTGAANTARPAARQGSGGADGSNDNARQNRNRVAANTFRQAIGAGFGTGVLRAGNTIGSFRAQTVADTENERVLGTTTLTTPPDNSFVVGAYFETIPAGGFARVGNIGPNATGAQVRLDQNNRVVLLRDTDGGVLFEFDARAATFGNGNTVTIRNAMSVPVGMARVGFWRSGFTVSRDGSPLSTVDPFHFAIANNLTSLSQLTSLGGITFSYSTIGGTATNETGASASMLVGSVGGVFAADPTLGSLGVGIAANFPVGSSGWSLSGGGTVADFMKNGGVPLAGTCCGAAGGAAGRITGRFVGTAAEGVTAAFSAERLGSNRIAGTFVGER